MKSATLAAFAPPECASAGMIVSESSSTSSYCAGVKNRALEAVCEASACGGAAGEGAACSSDAAAGSGNTAAPKTAAEVCNHCRRSCFKLMGSCADILPPHNTTAFVIELDSRIHSI